MKTRSVIVLLATAVASGSALAQSQTIEVLPGGHGLPPVNGNIQSNEYGAGNSYRYGVDLGPGRTPTASVTLTGPATSGAGGGNGFGGMLSQSHVFMNSSGGATPTLTVGFLPGRNMGNNDVFVMWLETNQAGTTGASPGSINDFTTVDRNAISLVNRNGTNGLPFTNNRVQHVITIFSGGIFLYRVENSGALTFLNGGSGTGTSVNQFRELAVPYANLGITALGTPIDFTVQLINGTQGFNAQFASNETLPASILNASSNPGTNTNSVRVDTFNRFIPTPGAAALLGLGGLMAARRRRD